MPHRLRKLPRIWAPEASLPGSYTRFIHFLTPFLPILVIERAQDRPFRPPRAVDFRIFLFTFCEGNMGAPRGGIMSLEGVKFSKRLKLPTDLFHHTHEVWGPCSYKNTPLRRHGPRVLASYCGLPLFRPHFSTLGHFHTTILVTTYFGVKIRCAAASGRGAYSTACISIQSAWKINLLITISSKFPYFTYFPLIFHLKMAPWISA